MTTSPLIAVDRSLVEGPLDDWGPRAGADSGEPMTAGKMLHAGGGGLPQVGVWECTPGGWAIENRPDTESFMLLSGRARLTDADGSSVELGPGEGAVLPRGWSGRWEIVATARKFYVLVE